MTAAAPTVSVVISTWNRANWLDDCLASLAAQQDADPFEVVVVDNASTDATPAVIARWCQRDPRFRGLREERLGLSVGKNAGAGVARGSLLLFTDDDVVAPPGWVQAYRTFFVGRSGELLVAGGHIRPVPADLRPWAPWFRSDYLPDVHELHHGPEGPLRPGSYVWGGNFAVTAEVFARLGPFGEELGLRGDQRGTFEDAEYQDRVRAAGGSIWFLPTAGLSHRVRLDWTTPRAILGVAFTRGRNSFWQRAGARPDRGKVAVTVRVLSGLCALGRDWTLWLCGVTAFRATGRAAALATAHRAAHRFGRSMERTCAGWPGRGGRWMERVVYRAHAIALRATPDRP
jgi:glycosyltransferase involved in cell wall biosynthesis